MTTIKLKIVNEATGQSTERTTMIPGEGKHCESCWESNEDLTVCYIFGKLHADEHGITLRHHDCLRVGGEG